MPRQISPSIGGALAADVVCLALFAELVFADQTLYLWSGLGTITPTGTPYNPASTFPYGQAFTGLGWLGKISTIPQTSKVQAQNVTIELSGIPSNLIAEIVGEVRLTGTVTIWYAFFDNSGQFASPNLLADPVQVFSGSMDVPSITDDGTTAAISIACENTLLSLNLAPNRRFDDPDQQLRYPGDLGFSFVQALQNLQTFWPSSAANSTPYPVYMTVTPSSVDVAVGGSVTIEVTVHYSDGSTYTRPSNTGTGPSFLLCAASSNPKIARWLYTATNNVVGVSPGECSIMARIPGPSATGGFGSAYRAVCNIFVHS